MKKREKAGSALLAAACLSGLMAGVVFAEDKTDTGASVDDTTKTSTKTSTKKSAGKHSCKGIKTTKEETTKEETSKSSCKGKGGCGSK